jgi:hypothetical protein
LRLLSFRALHLHASSAGISRLLLLGWMNLLLVCWTACLILLRFTLLSLDARFRFYGNLQHSDADPENSAIDHKAWSDKLQKYRKNVGGEAYQKFFRTDAQRFNADVVGKLDSLPSAFRSGVIEMRSQSHAGLGALRMFTIHLTEDLVAVTAVPLGLDRASQIANQLLW